MISALYIAAIIVLITTILYIFMMIVRCLVTYRNHDIIIDAMYAYHVDAIKRGKCEYEVNWSDIEEFDDTFRRLWDWGYKNILPKEKYEIIKDYIKSKKEKPND
jgi:hypothetical protein